MRLLPLLHGALSTARLAGALALRAPRPFSISFMLTNRCNFRCDYCDVPDAAGAEMSEAEVCRAIDELADAGMARASFSGGEALVRKDAAAIIRHAKARGLSTSLNTNGWLAEPILEEIAPHLDMIMVSLDGPERVHDRVRNRAGSFERVLRVLEGARALGIATSTITVLGPWNLDHIDDVLELADRRGFWAYFQPAYNECFDHRAGLHPVFTPTMLGDVAARLRSAKERGLPVGASAGFLERLAGGPRFSDCSRCAAGRYFAMVMPDGTVLPCHLTAGDATYLNGREVGFARAFHEMPHPTDGAGCAISPFQELDLIFSMDARAITDAASRLRGRRGRTR